MSKSNNWVTNATSVDVTKVNELERKISEFKGSNGWFNESDEMQHKLLITIGNGIVARMVNYESDRVIGLLPQIMWAIDRMQREGITDKALEDLWYVMA